MLTLCSDIISGSSTLSMNVSFIAIILLTLSLLKLCIVLFKVDFLSLGRVLSY